MSDSKDIAKADDGGVDRRGIGRFATTLAILTVIYWAFTCVCFRVLTEMGEVGLAWPPLALGVGIAAAMGRRYVPCVLLGSMLVPMTINHPAISEYVGRTLQFQIGATMGVADSIGAWIGATLIRQLLDERVGLAKLRDAVVFLLAVAPISAIGSVFSHQAIVEVVSGATNYHNQQDPLLSGIIKRVVCNGVSVAMLAPIVVVMWRRPSFPRGQRLVEAGAVGLSLVALSMYAFTSRPAFFGSTYALAYLPIPVLIWGSLRFGLKASLPLAAIMCVIAGWATVAQRGPLYKADESQSIMLFWGFTTVSATLALLVGAAVDERVRSMMLLESSERRYRELVENASEGIWMLDTSGRTTFANPRLAEMLGETTRSMIGRDPVAYAADPPAVEQIRQAIEASQSLGAGRLEPREVSLRRADGEVIHTLLSVTPLRDDGGSHGSMALVADISRRRLAEDALRASTERLEVAIWGTNIGLWEWDPRSNRVSFSSVWKRQLGYEPEELPDEYGSWESRLHPDDRERTLKRLQSFLANPIGHYESSFRLRRKDGSHLWIMARGYMTRDDRGEPVRMLGVHIDLSQLKAAQEELERSERRLRHALESARQGTWEWDIERRELHGSARMSEIFGLDPDFDTRGGLAYRDAIHPDDLARVASEWEAVISGERDFHCEYRLVRPDGQVRWVLSQGSLVRDSTGRAVRAAGVIADVTERKIAEDSLRESEGRFRAMFERHDSIMLLIDPDGSITDANDAASRFYGYSRERLRCMRVADVSDSSEDEIRERIADAVSGRRRSFVFQHRLAGGQTPYVEIHASPVEYEGRLLLFSVIHDITERFQAEHALRESEATQRALLHAIPDVLFRLDAAGRYLHVHAADPSALDHPIESYVGTTVHDKLPSRLARDVLACIERTLAGAGVQAFDTIVTRHGREAAWDVRMARAAEDEVVMLVRDITDRRQAQAERERLQDQLHRAQKLESLGILAGGVAHDFSNLLAGILGHVGLLQQTTPADAPSRQTLDTIEHTAQRASELTRQLLAYSGKSAAARQRVDLSAVASDILAILRSSLTPTATIELDLASNLPAVRADPTQVRQICMNLLTNASDSLGERAGTIRMSTGAQHADRDTLRHYVLGDDLPEGEYAYIEVSDSGAGIEAANIPRIFDPFFTTKFTGRGLGLAAVLGIVRGHRGAILVRSTPGASTTFRVLLPVDRSDDTPLGGVPAAASAVVPRDKRLALVVDDEKVVLTMAALALRQHGYDVLTADSGAKAVELFSQRADEIDAVLLDLTMPGMGGGEVLTRIRAIRPRTPVVLTSGYDHEDAAAKCRDDEPTSFLPKPYTIDALMRRMDAAVASGRSGAAAR